MSMPESAINQCSSNSFWRCFFDEVDKLRGGGPYEGIDSRKHEFAINVFWMYDVDAVNQNYCYYGDPCLHEVGYVSSIKNESGDIKECDVERVRLQFRELENGDVYIKGLGKNYLLRGDNRLFEIDARFSSGMPPLTYWLRPLQHFPVDGSPSITYDTGIAFHACTIASMRVYSYPPDNSDERIVNRFFWAVARQFPKEYYASQGSLAKEALSEM